MGIKGGHIDPGDLGNGLQETGLVPVFPFCPFIHIQDLHGNVLALPQGEEIHEIRQRLGIEGADAPGEDHIFQALPVRRMQRDTGEAQHIENIGIGHLVADGKGHHIEVLHRVLAFQCPQGKVILHHGLLHIPPGCKHSLAPHIADLIHDPVENAHPHIGHADLIGVREAEGHADGHLFLLLAHLPPFAAHIPGRLLHRGQDAAFQICHLVTSLRKLPIYCTRCRPCLQVIFRNLADFLSCPGFFPLRTLGCPEAKPPGTPQHRAGIPAEGSQKRRTAQMQSLSSR